jgi:hypothetical protein
MFPLLICQLPAPAWPGALPSTPRNPRPSELLSPFFGLNEITKKGSESVTVGTGSADPIPLLFPNSRAES